MHEKPKLQCTKDYSLFEMHEINRDICDHPVLEASMRTHGFMPSHPIQCIRTGRGKLKVIVGHHRLHYAKRLGLFVWYVVDDSNVDIYELEVESTLWTIRHWLTSRAKGGDPHCRKVLEFQQKHHLTQGAAISLVGGESANSKNKIRAVKKGAFRAASDTRHADAVVGITDHCRDCGVPFATQSAFVGAVSLVVRVPECDLAVLRHRITLAAGQLRKRSTLNDYLEEIEALYNYAAKSKRVPLVFRAREIARERQASFGGNRGMGGKNCHGEPEKA